MTRQNLHLKKYLFGSWVERASQEDKDKSGDTVAKIQLRDDFGLE